MTPAMESPIGTRRPLWSDDAEHAVLSAMLAEPAAIETALTVLDSAAFYHRAHRTVFEAMVGLYRSEVTVDPFTVADALAADGTLEACGGKDFLGFLVDVVPTAASVQYHAGIVRDHAARREVLTRLHEASRAITDEGMTAREVTQALYAALLPFSADTSTDGFRHVKDHIWPLMEQIEARSAGGARGLMTGFHQIDHETNGFRPGELIIVGAVEKVGKSAIALNIARRVLLGPAPCGVAIVSAEMSAESLTERMLAMIARIELVTLAKGALVDDHFPRLAQAAGALGAAPLWIDDAAEPALDDVVARATKLKADHPEVGLIIVDFLQLLTAPEKGQSEQRELKRIAYGLKALAKRLGVVVLAPCQVNSKDIEEFKERRPRLKDLQGSSGMRQAADFIALAYREGLYNEHAASADVMELNFAACRRTRKFLAYLDWNGDLMLLSDR